MRRIPLILGLVLIAALIVHDVYEFFVTNEGIRYFSSEPSRLLYVILLGIAGGMVALGISRISPASQRKLKPVRLHGRDCAYTAAEHVPVATDAISDIAEGTQGSVNTVARAVTEGVKEGSADKKQ